MKIGVKYLFISMLLAFFLLSCNAGSLDSESESALDSPSSLTQEPSDDDFNPGPMAAPPISLPAPGNDETAAGDPGVPIDLPLHPCAQYLDDEEAIRNCIADSFERNNPCLGQNYDENEIAACMRIYYSSGEASSEGEGSEINLDFRRSLEHKIKLRKLGPAVRPLLLEINN